jgi:hypothetical protein
MAYERYNGVGHVTDAQIEQYYAGGMIETEKSLFMNHAGHTGCKDCFIRAIGYITTERPAQSDKKLEIKVIKPGVRGDERLKRIDPDDNH